MSLRVFLNRPSSLSCIHVFSFSYRSLSRSSNFLIRHSFSLCTQHAQHTTLVFASTSTTVFKMLTPWKRTDRKWMSGIQSMKWHLYRNMSMLSRQHIFFLTCLSLLLNVFSRLRTVLTALRNLTRGCERERIVSS